MMQSYFLKYLITKLWFQHGGGYGYTMKKFLCHFISRHPRKKVAVKSCLRSLSARFNAFYEYILRYLLVTPAAALLQRFSYRAE